MNIIISLFSSWGKGGGVRGRDRPDRHAYVHTKLGNNKTLSFRVCLIIYGYYNFIPVSQYSSKNFSR